LWADGIKGAEIHTFLLAQYGDNTVTHWSVYEWIEMSKNCLKNVMNVKCLWQPSSSATDEKQEEGSAIILANTSECNNRRNHIIFRCQWSFGPFFSAWVLCYENFPQGMCPNFWPKVISATANKSAVVVWTCASIQVITSWITLSLVMKPVFIIKNQKPNCGVCSGSKHLLLPKNPRRTSLPVSSCWLCSGTSQGLSLNIIWTGVSLC